MMQTSDSSWLSYLEKVWSASCFTRKNCFFMVDWAVSTQLKQNHGDLSSGSRRLFTHDALRLALTLVHPSATPSPSSSSSSYLLVDFPTSPPCSRGTNGRAQGGRLGGFFVSRQGRMSVIMFAWWSHGRWWGSTRSRPIGSRAPSIRICR